MSFAEIYIDKVYDLLAKNVKVSVRRFYCFALFWDTRLSVSRASKYVVAARHLYARQSLRHSSAPFKASPLFADAYLERNQL